MQPHENISSVGDVFVFSKKRTPLCSDGHRRGSYVLLLVFFDRDGMNDDYLASNTRLIMHNVRIVRKLISREDETDQSRLSAWQKPHAQGYDFLNISIKNNFSVKIEFVIYEIRNFPWKPIFNKCSPKQRPLWYWWICQFIHQVPYHEINPSKRDATDRGGMISKRLQPLHLNPTVIFDARLAAKLHIFNSNGCVSLISYSMQAS